MGPASVAGVSHSVAGFAPTSIGEELPDFWARRSILGSLGFVDLQHRRVAGTTPYKRKPA
jgi:hypothetical protein